MMSCGFGSVWQHDSSLWVSNSQQTITMLSKRWKLLANGTVTPQETFINRHVQNTTHCKFLCHCYAESSVKQ